MIALLATLLAVVNNPNPSVTYACDGVTAVYTVSFPYQQISDLQVTSTTPAGTATILVYTTNYLLNLSSTSSTATLTLTNPASKCPSGNTLKIGRSLALTQPTSFKAQTQFNPSLHEQAYDREVMLIQQVDAKVAATDIKAYVDQVVNATLTGGTVVQPLTWPLTGDGATSVFSIPNAVVSSPDLYFVMIDGVVQRPTTDYTVSSGAATITFASAPALNAIITVRSTGYARALSVGDNTSVLATGTSVPRVLKDRFADITYGPDFGVVPDGTDVSTRLNNALTAKIGIVYLPPSATCYNIGGTTINMPSNRILQGAGMGTGGTQGPTCITYTGTGCGILLNDVQGASLRDFELDVNTTSATARGICIQGTAVNAQYNEIEGVYVKMTNATRRTAGQIGVLVKDNGAGAYWNTFHRLRAAFWDVSFKQEGGAFGSNANHWDDLASFGHTNGYKATGSTVTDNRIFGMHCSRSDGSLVGNTNCVVLGDDGTSVDFNFFYGITSDAGAPSVCFTMGVASYGNVVDADCQSGGPVTDGNTNASFKNRIYDTINGATPGLYRVPRLTVSVDADITGTFFSGITPTGNVTGGIVQVKGGTAGPGNNDGGSVYLLPGVKTGTGAAGGVVIGNTSSRGVRIQATRVTPATKNVAPVDCAGAGIGATTSQILDGSIFTCATAQNLTMPTSQGAAGIVQNLAGATTTAPPAVGDLFQFYVSSTAAANFTLVAGAGGTIVGNAVVNNASKIWTCRVTSVAGGAETLSCY